MYKTSFYVNNIKSDKIEQAIFILKSDFNTSNKDVAKEAQAIINDYMYEIEALKNPFIKIPNKTKNFHKFMVFLTAVFLVAVLLYFIL